MSPAWTRALGWLLVWALLVPVAHSVWVSFSPDMLLTPPVAAWSLRWHIEFMGDPQWTRALGRSLLAAVLAAGVAVPLGAMAALAPARHGAAMAVLMAPACVPAAALGLGLLVAAHAAGLAGTWAALVLAHALMGLPVAVQLARLGCAAELELLRSAARGLGAGPWETARRVTLPLLAPWLWAAAGAVFLISFNDAVVAVFVCGPDTETLPVVAWRQLRHAAGPLVAVAGVASLACAGGVAGVVMMIGGRATPE
ncbi:MAG: ABC transporter permease [Planctomycetota bacterium]